MLTIPWYITLVAFFVGIVGVLAVGAAAALLAQEIIRRLDGRALRLPTTGARFAIFACLLIGIGVESYLMHRAWGTLAAFWITGGGALKISIALASGPAAVIILVVISYLIFAPEAICTMAGKSVSSELEPRLCENIIPVPLALATRCIPIEELRNGMVVFLVKNCPDRVVHRMLVKKLGARVRYLHARSEAETGFLKNFLKAHGNDYRPVIFEKGNFLNRVDAVEHISRGRRPDAEAAAAHVPKDSVLLVETAVHFYSRRVFSIDPQPLFAADWGTSYWPYMSASMSDDGELILTRHYKSHVRSEVPGLLIFENRIVDGDVHGCGIRLVNPSDWIAMELPSDYRVAGLDDKGNLVIEIAGKVHTVPQAGCPTGFFDEKYFLLAGGRIFERRLRLSVRNFHLIPRDKVILAAPAAATPPPLHETIEFPSFEKPSV